MLDRRFPRSVLLSLTAILGPILCIATVPATLSLASANAGNPQATQESPLTFEQHVRPILKVYCFDCHGEGDQLRGGVDLRLTRFMLRGGDSGPVLTPGLPNASRMYELVKSG